MSSSSPIDRCLAEQRKALDVWRSTGDPGAWLWLMDWLTEEVILRRDA